MVQGSGNDDELHYGTGRGGLHSVRIAQGEGMRGHPLAVYYRTKAEQIERGKDHGTDDV